jgi:uncharacterized membrane protein YdbT with pleckstrin-like domain
MADQKEFKDEKTSWVGRPSQIINLRDFALTAIGISLALAFYPALAPIPALYGLWRFLETRSVNYEITNQRIIIKEGLLYRKSNEVEMYRIRDYNVDQDLLQRIFGVSDVSLRTAERDSDYVRLNSIKNGETVKDMIRKHVEFGEGIRTVREVEMSQ